jgi:hypothetical protein
MATNTRIPPGAQQAGPIRRGGRLPMDAHLAAAGGVELDDAVLQRRRMRRDQFHECRLGCFPTAAGNSAEPLLQPHIIQPERVRYGIHTVLPGQFDRSLPQ